MITGGAAATGTRGETVTSTGLALAKPPAWAVPEPAEPGLPSASGRGEFVLDGDWVRTAASLADKAAPNTAAGVAAAAAGGADGGPAGGVANPWLAEADPDLPGRNSSV